MVAAADGSDPVVFFDDIHDNPCAESVEHLIFFCSGKLGILLQDIGVRGVVCLDLEVRFLPGECQTDGTARHPCGRFDGVVTEIGQQGNQVIQLNSFIQDRF